jgi:hypothetical protein
MVLRAMDDAPKRDFVIAGICGSLGIGVTVLSACIPSDSIESKLGSTLVGLLFIVLGGYFGVIAALQFLRAWSDGECVNNDGDE